MNGPLIILFFISFGHVNSKFHDVRPELRSLLPSNILNFMDNFTPEEQEIVETADDSKGIKGYLKNIAEKNPDLAQRASILVENLITKMKSLPNSTHDFVRTVMKSLDAKMGKLNDKEVKETAAKLLKGFNELSEEDRNELQFVFPTIFDTLSSDDFKDLAKGKGLGKKEDHSKEKSEKSSESAEDSKPTTTTKKPKSKKKSKTTTVAPTTVATE